ncbi:hypothetical protein EVAR_42999_1 [Eumeta japonica]|uniref:DUF4789 domain-containing protein n=1 Tax=Eumeta variegata TaxID=151549 RepID=A0A4C1WCS5_EUMVA|nr:hypothetical protein EVAR_42999_1 [Eumeta japonica]
MYNYVKKHHNTFIRPTTSTRCIPPAPVPCARGRLYVPERRRCDRPGAPEPCPAGEVVAFDFEARPSLDGISHNGVCACGGGVCARKEVAACTARRGAAVFDGACHFLNTQGPCQEGSWLVQDQGNVRCRYRTEGKNHTLYD